MEEIKNCLGFRRHFRKTELERKGYSLREPQNAYTSVFDTQKRVLSPKNAHFSNLIPLSLKT